MASRNVLTSPVCCHEVLMSYQSLCMFSDGVNGDELTYLSDALDDMSSQNWEVRIPLRPTREPALKSTYHPAVPEMATGSSQCPVCHDIRDVV